jgi:pimeloyl-ACP methyl ester carboxylesterase
MEALKTYLKEIRLLDLLEGLNYLAQAQMPVSSLASLRKISILHGEQDKICPFKEVEIIQCSIPKAKFISLPCAGHILFLNRNLKELLSHG